MRGQLDDYRIVREMGRGGMGIVYERLHQRPRPLPGLVFRERGGVLRVMTRAYSTVNAGLASPVNCHTKNCGY
jgi:hypothetical protein